MEEEVHEYKEGVEAGDVYNLAKELADILYTVYGTILEHGLQDIIEDVFEEVHHSNMTKIHIKGSKNILKVLDTKRLTYKKFLRTR